MGKLTKQDLLNHMEQFKDTVVIFGSKSMSYEIDLEAFSKLTPKSLKRDPEMFWNTYKESILKKDMKSVPAQKVLEKLKDSIKVIYSQPMDSSFADTTLKDKVVYLHGEDTMYKCTKCKTFYPQPFIDTFEKETPTCECCGGVVRPNILFDKEGYDNAMFHKLKEDILETHTLLLVGFDFGEDPLLNLVIDYSEMKDQRNLQEPEKRMLVTVGKDDMYDISELANFEFIVPGDVNESMLRLIED